MGKLGLGWFLGEKDKEIVSQISKEYDVDYDVVEAEYKKCIEKLKEIKHEIKA